MSDHYIMFVYYKLLVYLCASHQIITDFCNYNLTVLQGHKRSQPPSDLYIQCEKMESKKKKEKENALQLDVTAELYSPQFMRYHGG